MALRDYIISTDQYYIINSQLSYHSVSMLFDNNLT